MSTLKIPPEELEQAKQHAARFIIGNILQEYKEKEHPALHPTMLFSILMALDTIQCVSNKPVWCSVSEIREQIFGQFKIDFGDLIEEGLQNLRKRLLVTTNGSEWRIRQRQGTAVARMLLLEPERIAAYQRRIMGAGWHNLIRNNVVHITVWRGRTRGTA